MFIIQAHPISKFSEFWNLTTSEATKLTMLTGVLGTTLTTVPQVGRAAHYIGKWGEIIKVTKVKRRETPQFYSAGNVETPYVMQVY